uniref:Uncharacterized protein n=1 Tax=Human herpesvirus 2 TaxID=10310 RepID=A0A481TQ38_HHV2|nr:hypothetical protein [Human alphaherpesvirus 2]
MHILHHASVSSADARASMRFSWRSTQSRMALAVDAARGLAANVR